MTIQKSEMTPDLLGEHESFRAALFSMIVQTITPEGFEKYEKMCRWRGVILKHTEPEDRSPEEQNILQNLENIEADIVIGRVLAPAMGITTPDEVDELKKIFHSTNAKQLDAIYDAGKVNQLFDEKINLMLFKGWLEKAEPVEVDQGLLGKVLKDKPESAELITGLVAMINKSIEMNKDGSLMQEVDEKIEDGQEKIGAITGKY